MTIAETGIGMVEDTEDGTEGDMEGDMTRDADKDIGISGELDMVIIHGQGDSAWMQITMKVSSSVMSVKALLACITDCERITDC